MRIQSKMVRNADLAVVGIHLNLNRLWNALFRKLADQLAGRNRYV